MNEIRNFNKNGGNAFGIKESEGPLISRSYASVIFYSFLIILRQSHRYANLWTVLSLTIFYNSHPRRYARDDPLVRKAAENIMYRWRMMAQGHGMWHPYKYINYADGGDDVFAGYGQKQREWLRKVKRDLIGKERWDVGGFKV